MRKQVSQIIDNLDGTNSLVISAIPDFDFSSNLTRVDLFHPHAEPSAVPLHTYFSTREILNNNQKITSVFPFRCQKERFRLK